MPLLTVSSTLFSFSRRSWSSSETISPQQDVGSTSDSHNSSRATSPFTRTTEEEHFNPDRFRWDPETGGPVQVSVSASLDASEQTGSREDHPEASFSDCQERSGSTSDDSSTPVASITGSPSSSTSAPALRLTRQLSVGGAGSSNQNYQPFPHRKPPRISEAARRLGMYSSF